VSSDSQGKAVSYDDAFGMLPYIVIVEYKILHITFESDTDKLMYVMQVNEFNLNTNAILSQHSQHRSSIHSQIKIKEDDGNKAQHLSSSSCEDNSNPLE
jgi:hypothetical protein